jgi:murein L,D-transpeptidase YcbB/YkuD
MADTQINRTEPSETNAETNAETEAMFSPDDAIETLWVKTYEGEVLGETLFARMAEQATDPVQKHKMQVLSTMERRTREMLVEPLQRAGLSTEPDAKTVAEAETLAEAMADVAWSDFISSFEPITSQYAAMYARIGELNPAERATADLLVAHELALRDFGRLELDGKGDDSLRAITALPHLQ